jgi:hypothetical protein
LAPGKTDIHKLLGAVHDIMQSPDRRIVPPSRVQGRPTPVRYRIDMRSTALKILQKGADASLVGRKATK